MAKPVVDGLERELEGKMTVLRLNVTDSVGGVLAGRYQVRGVPTFVLLDGEGEAIQVHIGRIDREMVVEAVERLVGE